MDSYRGDYDSETGIAKIFKNGYEQGSIITEGGSINWDYISDMDMKIGRSVNIDIGELDGYFSGSIDEVRLWNYALEANQIQSTMCIPQLQDQLFDGLLEFQRRK